MMSNSAIHFWKILACNAAIIHQAREALMQKNVALKKSLDAGEINESDYQKRRADNIEAFKLSGKQVMKSLRQG